MEYNGSAIMAMVGKNCVAIAADKRFGVQALTLGCDFQKIFRVNDQCFIGLPGLASDVETLYVPQVWGSSPGSMRSSLL